MFQCLMLPLFLACPSALIPSRIHAYLPHALIPWFLHAFSLFSPCQLLPRPKPRPARIFEPPLLSFAECPSLTRSAWPNST